MNVFRAILRQRVQNQPDPSFMAGYIRARDEKILLEAQARATSLYGGFTPMYSNCPMEEVAAALAPWRGVDY